MSLLYALICPTLFSLGPRLTNLLLAARVAGAEKAQFKVQISHKLDLETLLARILDLTALMVTCTRIQSASRLCRRRCRTKILRKCLDKTSTHSCRTLSGTWRISMVCHEAQATRLTTWSKSSSIIKLRGNRQAAKLKLSMSHLSVALDGNHPRWNKHKSKGENQISKSLAQTANAW